MSYGLKTPQITSNGSEGQFQQLRSYIYQLIQELNYVLNDIDKRINEDASKIDSNVQTPSDTFESIKELIGHSEYLKSVFGSSVVVETLTVNFNGATSANVTHTFATGERYFIVPIPVSSYAWVRQNICYSYLSGNLMFSADSAVSGSVVCYLIRGF